jgi:hypothetical protein
VNGSVTVSVGFCDDVEPEFEGSDRTFAACGERWRIETIGVGAIIGRNRTGGADDDRSAHTGRTIAEQRAASAATCIACRASAPVTPVFGCASDVDRRRPGCGRAPRARPAEGRAYGGVRKRDYGEHPSKRTATCWTLTVRSRPTTVDEGHPEDAESSVSVPV